MSIQIGDKVRFQPSNVHRYRDVCDENRRIHNTMKDKDCFIAGIAADGSGKPMITKLKIEDKIHCITFTGYEIERYLIVSRTAQFDSIENLIGNMIDSFIPGALGTIPMQEDPDLVMLKRVRELKNEKAAIEKAIEQAEKEIKEKRKSRSAIIEELSNIKTKMFA